MAKEAELPPNALVIRFKPMDLEKCLKRIDIDQRDTGSFGLSVFAATPLAGETRTELEARLVAASELQGISKSNRVFYECTEARELIDRKFTFCKDDTGDPEVPEHYTVDFGRERPTLDDVQRFIDAFDPEPKRRPS